MNDTLLAGTICFITQSEQMPQYNGHAVEIVGPWINPQEYQIDAEWLRQAFPDSAVIAARENLLPLLPPELETTTRTKAVA